LEPARVPTNGNRSIRLESADRLGGHPPYSDRALILVEIDYLLGKFLGVDAELDFSLCSGSVLIAAPRLNAAWVSARFGSYAPQGFPELSTRKLNIARLEVFVHNRLNPNRFDFA
jgi:hypothetical protein